MRIYKKFPIDRRLMAQKCPTARNQEGLAEEHRLLAQWFRNNKRDIEIMILHRGLRRK
jgi:hypothetical protein